MKTVRQLMEEQFDGIEEAYRLEIKTRRENSIVNGGTAGIRNISIKHSGKCTDYRNYKTTIKVRRMN